MFVYFALISFLTHTADAYLFVIRRKVKMFIEISLNKTSEVIQHEICNYIKKNYDISLQCTYLIVGSQVVLFALFAFVIALLLMM